MISEPDVGRLWLNTSAYDLLKVSSLLFMLIYIYMKLLVALESSITNMKLWSHFQNNPGNIQKQFHRAECNLQSSEWTGKKDCLENVLSHMAVQVLKPSPKCTYHQQLTYFGRNSNKSSHPQCSRSRMTLTYYLIEGLPLTEKLPLLIYTGIYPTGLIWSISLVRRFQLHLQFNFVFV